MLEAITLQNFKGYERYHVIFPPGLTLITGPNYSGKTRLLHAVLFAFWGVSAVPGGSKLVPTRGHKPSDTVVHARFYHQHHTYEIERKISTAKLFKDQELIASSTSAVNRELETIFNTPQKFFMRLKYAEQSETQALLTLGAAELHKVIEHVSGATIVNRVIDRASKAATAAQNGLDAIGPTHDLTALREQEQSLAGQLTAMAQNLEALKANDGKLQTQVTTLEETLELAEANNVLHHARKQAHQERTNKLATARASLTSAENEVETYKAAADGHTALSEELADANEYASLWKDLQRGMQTRRENFAKTQARLQQSHAEHATASQELADLGTHDNSTAFQALLDADANLRDAKTKERELVNACENAVCPTCLRPFEDQDTEGLIKQLDEAKDAVKFLIPIQEAAQTYAVQEEAKMLTISAKRRRVEDLAAEFTRLTTEVGQQQAELVVLEAEVKQSQQPPTAEYMADLRDRVTRAAQAAGAVAAAQARITKATSRIKSEEQILNGLEPPPPFKDVSEWVKQLGPLRQQAKETNRLVLSGTSAYGIRYSEWTQLKAKVDTEVERQEKVRGLQRQKQTAAALAKYLRTNRDRFLQELWDQVMGYASNLASICTGGVIERVERTPSGTFQYLEEGELAMIEGASGAQKSIMSIGVQLALDTLLPDTFGALLLDEPTSQMDEDRSLMLTQMLAQTGQQIIMVSHRAMDATVAQSHIHLE